jgi:hypothetical protein
LSKIKEKHYLAGLEFATIELKDVVVKNAKSI